MNYKSNATKISFVTLLCLARTAAAADHSVNESPAGQKNLARQIFETMVQVHGVESGRRPVHARGMVCQGTFSPSDGAARLSQAAHFQKSSVAIPVTVRFSDGSPDSAIPDNSPNAGPRGMAIRFHLPDNGETDIVAMSHNGFVVANGEEFLALQKAIVATDPSKPHPWPVEQFLSTHPRALKFVQENAIVPASFATESFFSNNSFVLVNGSGVRQTIRYQIIPAAGQKHLTEAEAKARSADYLTRDLQQLLVKGPVEFKLLAQIPNPEDPTNDPSLVWPNDRKLTELGTLHISSIVPDSRSAEAALAFDPTNLTRGIELSDDELPALRSRVYALSVKRRQP